MLSSAKHICIIRHPLGVRSKKDRLNISDIIEFLIAIPFLQRLAQKQAIFVRYEDLIASSSVLNKIYAFLGVSSLDDKYF